MMSPRVREAILFMAAFYSGYQFYNGYWKWRDCFSDTVTRCTTPDGHTVLASDKFWMVPAVLCFIAAMQLVMKRRPKP